MDNNRISFGSATRVYFFTTDGKRIISDKNMRKCERYLVRQLNGAKNLKSRNQELIDTFKYDKKQGIGDYDYYCHPKVRSVYEVAKDRVKGFVNIITGKHTEEVDKWGKEIGKAKRMTRERTGQTRSFEVSDAVRVYNSKAPVFADKHGIYKDGKRQAFGVIFTPKYNKKGELKEFVYDRSGYFNEEFIS